MTGGSYWFAFFDFHRHSDGLLEAGTCYPFVRDASVKILRSQGFLVMQKTNLLRGY
jgi:hypothetical protein